MYVFHHDNRGVDHRPDGHRDPPQGHDVDGELLVEHGNEGEEHGQGQGEHGDERAARVQQEEEDEHADHDHLFDQGVAKSAHRGLDELRSVIGGYDGHPGGQGGANLLDPFLHPLDDRKRVLPVPHDHDPTHRLPGPVEFGHPAPDLGTQRHHRHVAHGDRQTVLTGGEGNDLQVPSIPHIAPAADHVLVSRRLQQASPHFLVGSAYGIDHPLHGDSPGAQAIGVHQYLVLLDEPAHRRHLGHPGDGLQRVAQVPVLQGAQLGQVKGPAGIHQGRRNRPSRLRWHPVPDAGRPRREALPRFRSGTP